MWAPFGKDLRALAGMNFDRMMLDFYINLSIIRQKDVRHFSEKLIAFWKNDAVTCQRKCAP